MRCYCGRNHEDHGTRKVSDLESGQKIFKGFLLSHWGMPRPCSLPKKNVEWIFSLQLDSDKLKSLYIEFFKEKNHKVIPNAPLVPKGDDPTVLFTTAGMHPLVPFLAGEMLHEEGKRLVNVQKCLRTDDIFEIGRRLSPYFLRDARQLVSRRLFQRGFDTLEL
jgi:hypothetical protein